MKVLSIYKMGDRKYTYYLRAITLLYWLRLSQL